MTMSLSDRVLLKQRKWYVQPLDPGSSEKIYRLLKDAESVNSKDAIGCPNENGYRLRETDQKTVMTLMEETSLGGLTPDGRDFGPNFYVYVKEKTDRCPHFCFASTREMREENAKKHKLRQTSGPVKLKIIVSTQEETKKPFVLRKEEPEIKNKEIIPLAAKKRKTLYRITTHQKRMISLLEEELSLAGEETEPVPHTSEGNESVWNVPPEVVLKLKIHAKVKFLHFRIWKKDDKGCYFLIGQYPLQFK